MNFKKLETREAPEERNSKKPFYFRTYYFDFDKSSNGVVKFQGLLLKVYPLKGIAAKNTKQLHESARYEAMTIVNDINKRSVENDSYFRSPLNGKRRDLYVEKAKTLIEE